MKPSDSQLRICMVVESAGAGTGRHVTDLTQALVESGHCVHVIYSPGRAEPSFLDRLKATGCKTLAVPISRSISLKDAAAARAVRRYLKQEGPFDIVHGHSSKGGAIARLAGLGSARIVYTAHAFAAMDPIARPVKRFIFSRIESLLSRMTDAVICVSPEEEQFARSIRIAPGKLKVVPNGIGSIEFCSKAEARSKLSLRDEDLVVGFVGRLSKQKAPDVLLCAFALAAINMQRARLVMIGDGPLKESLQQTAGALGINSKINWLGACDARQVMPAFDLLAISSRYEGMPYVALEAMAAGLPLVATRAGGCGLLIEEGANGFIVNVDDAAALADRIKSLLADEQLRLAFAAESKSRVKDFTIDRMTDATVQIYHQLLAGTIPSLAERPVCRPAI